MPHPMVAFPGGRGRPKGPDGRAGSRGGEVDGRGGLADAALFGSQCRKRDPCFFCRGCRAQSAQSGKFKKMRPDFSGISGVQRQPKLREPLPEDRNAEADQDEGEDARERVGACGPDRAAHAVAVAVAEPDDDHGGEGRGHRARDVGDVVGKTVPSATDTAMAPGPW